MESRTRGLINRGWRLPKRKHYARVILFDENDKDDRKDIKRMNEESLLVALRFNLIVKRVLSIFNYSFSRARILYSNCAFNDLL